MIPKSSQRSNASGLAAHLLNAEDNELVQVMVIKGGIADDLTGWARETEASFLAMTKGQNPFYHVQISPDFRQSWNDDLTHDYVARILFGLGLDGQNHALVRHIKEMPDGIMREHYHLVVSRLNINECKAIPISFDHIKLQHITRDFARDHNLELPPGYYNFNDRAKQTYRQQTLYEKKQSDRGLPSTEEHQEIITPLWEGRVSPEGFIKALDHHGYMLAVGRRPVVIDIFGEQHSLARLIDLKETGVKAVRDYLGDAYNEDDLPSVEEAKGLVADHIAKTKSFERKEERAEKLDALKSGQAVRRDKLDAEISALLERDSTERVHFDRFATDERRAHRNAFVEQRREVRAARDELKPSGLAAFLGRITGVTLIQKKIHAYRDRVALQEHLDAKRAIVERQHNESEELRLSHQMRALDTQRQRRELSYREAQEITSLENHLEKQARLLTRGVDAEPTPAPHLALTPFGRSAVPTKAMERFNGSSYKDRATKEEFHNFASPDHEDRLAPTKIEAETSDVGPSPTPEKVPPRNVDTAPLAREAGRPPITEVPTKSVQPINENLREARRRGAAVPRPGELTSHFDAAAQHSNEGEQRSSSDGDSKAPAQATQKVNENSPTKPELSDAVPTKEEIQQIEPKPAQSVAIDHKASVSPQPEMPHDYNAELDQQINQEPAPMPQEPVPDPLPALSPEPGQDAQSIEVDTPQPQNPDIPSSEPGYDHER